MNVKIQILFFFSIQLIIKGQQINMNFPKFSGKRYEFIIFQGQNEEVVHKGMIPNDGKFTLMIPEKYNNYIGMSRWLITGTEEGGGLDMFIPGHDFSVNCFMELPNEDNIIFDNNSENNEFNKVFKIQESILSRYRSMNMVTQFYDKSYKYYTLFKSEENKQKSHYLNFLKKINKNKSYLSHFLHVVNITNGREGILENTEAEMNKYIIQYISNELDWDILYTTGHWSYIIEYWLDNYINVFKNSEEFLKDFESVTSNIRSNKVYNDFLTTVYYYLNQFGKKEYLDLISYFNYK